VRPLIFISHSAKDREIGPVDPADASAVERRKVLEYTRLVRSEIVDALMAMTDAEGDRRFDVWLDQDTLAGGDDWTAKLHHALGRCDGAVILLDRHSVESEWVRKEATILSWRQSLTSNVLVVPVVVEPLHEQPLDAGAWRAMGIRRLQDVPPAADLTDAGARDQALAVAQRFATLRRDDAETPMGRWVAEVGGLIEEARGSARRGAARCIGIEDAEWNALSDPCAAMAHHLLHAGLNAAYDPTQMLLGGLSSESGRRLVSLLVPTWVRAQAAGDLHSAVTTDDARLVALSVKHQDSAVECLERAWCGSLDRAAIVKLPGITGEHVDELRADIEAGVRESLGYSDDEDEFVDEDLARSDAFIIVGANGARPQVVEATRLRFPTARLLLWPADLYAAAQAMFPVDITIDPGAHPDDEKNARVTSKRLTRNIL
jgi:hypothetical protein